MEQTLLNIKDDFAKSKHYSDFNHLILDDLYTQNIDVINSTINELLIEVQRQCLRNVSDKVNLSHIVNNTHIQQCIDVTYSNYGLYGLNNNKVIVNKESITTEDNIIK